MATEGGSSLPDEITGVPDDQAMGRVPLSDPIDADGGASTSPPAPRLVVPPAVPAAPVTSPSTGRPAQTALRPTVPVGVPGGATSSPGPGQTPIRRVDAVANPLPPTRGEPNYGVPDPQSGPEARPERQTGYRSTEVQEAIQHQSRVSDSRYEAAKARASEERRRIMEGLKSAGTKVVKAAVIGGAAYFGYHLFAGHTFAHAISNFPTTLSGVGEILNKAKDVVYGAGQKIVAWGQGIEKGFFNYSQIEPNQGGWFQRAMIKIGNVVKSTGIDMDPNKFSIGATKIVGAPFAAVFGKGSIFNKEMKVIPSLTGGVRSNVSSVETNFPQAGSWTEPVVGLTGALAGVWAYRKASKILNRKIGDLFPVWLLKRHEKKALKQSVREYRTKGDTAQAKEASLARKYLDERVSNIKTK